MNSMTNKLFLTTIAVASFSTPAFAGAYVNVESNSGFAGNDYGSTLLETHFGVEGEVNASSWYIQGGPALNFPDGSDSVTAVSGKVGGSVTVTEKTSVYGEVAAMTPEGLEFENVSVGVKAGLKYKF